MDMVELPHTRDIKIAGTKLPLNDEHLINICRLPFDLC